MPRSKFAKDAHTKRETFEARAILDEKGNRYKIAWKAIDPATDRPYEPTWEPKRYANASLKHEWAAKKSVERHKLKQTANANSEDSVSTTKNHAGLKPYIDKTFPIRSAANASATEQLSPAPLPTNKPTAQGQLSEKPTTTRNAREKLARARSAKATTTGHAATLPLLAKKLSSKTPASTSRQSSGIDAASCQHKRKDTKERTDGAHTQRRNGDGSGPSGTGAPSGSGPSSGSMSASSPSSLPHNGPSQPAPASQPPSVSSSSSSSSSSSISTASAGPKKRKRKTFGWTKHKAGHRHRHPQPPAYDIYYAAVGIMDERSDRYLIAWSPDPLTGEAFPDTWEPKDYVMPLMAKEWKQRKMRIAVESAEEELRGVQVD